MSKTGLAFYLHSHSLFVSLFLIGRGLSCKHSAEKNGHKHTKKNIKHKQKKYPT
jgi:hypothetical protein